MANFYIDPVAGNDANAGTLAAPWKTLTNGATAPRIAPGDEIRIKKSDAPAAAGINATFTNNSSALILASALTQTIERCENAWTPSANVTATAVSSPKIEGANAGSLAIAAAFTTGLIAYRDISPIDISPKTHICFWIRPTSDIAANTLAILLDDTSGCVSPVETINIPHILKANIWNPVLVPIATPANCTAIVSVGLSANSDPGTVTLYVDNIEACTTTLNLRTLIGKNDGVWYPVYSIVGTAVVLGSHASGARPYAGTSETVALYTLNPTPMSLAANDEWTLQDSGSGFASLIVIRGGWNFSTDTQDGQTFLDGVNYAGSYTGLYANAKSWFRVERMHFVRCQYAINLYVPKAWELKDVSSIGCIGYPYISSGADSSYHTINGLKSIHNGLYGLYLFGGSACTTPYEANDILSIGNGNHGILCHHSTYSGVIGRNWTCRANTGYGLDIMSGYARCESLTTENNTFGGVQYETVSQSMSILHNTIIAEATKVNFTQNTYKGEWPLKSLIMTDYLGTPGDDRQYQRGGVVARDTANAESGACIAMTPAVADKKLVAEIYPIAVAQGVAVTATLRMKKSAAYNGNNPRTRWVQNGVYQGEWESHPVTTSYANYQDSYAPNWTGFAYLLIDCDGTAGAVYVDNVTVA